MGLSNVNSKLKVTFSTTKCVCVREGDFLKDKNMKIQIFLVICSVTLRINCQSLKPTRTYNGYQPNSGQLFFNDNLPTDLNINNPNLRADYDDVQRTSQQAQMQPNDSYQQAQQNAKQNANRPKIVNQPVTQNQNINYNNQNQPQQNQYLNQNGNNQFRPSLELLPPLYSSQDYYNTKRGVQQSIQKNEGIADDRVSAEVDPVPLTLNNVSQEDMRKMSTVVTHIGLFMMKNAKDDQSNVVISPLSVVNILALLQTGATGETQNQISNALQRTPEMTAAAFRLMNDDFRKRGTQRNVLKTASGIFAADAFDLNRDFKNSAIQNFGSEVAPVSFADPNVAAQKINSWIASKTNDKIDNLVAPSSLGINTQLVLANAIYFKGIWETMFKPEATMQKNFNMRNGQKKPVPFMSLRSSFKCGMDKTINSLVAVLPFEDHQYSLVMVLPGANTNVKDVLASMSADKLADYQNIPSRDTLIEIPKFTVRANTDLHPIFTRMGITKMFTGASELNNIGMYRTASPEVSSAVHSAIMSIDEKGATAAAASVVAVVALSYDIPSVVFRADRPFLAVLWDNNLNLALFMTKIENPSL